MYKSYSFTKSKASLQKHVDDENRVDEFLYRCSEKNRKGCKARLLVNLAGKFVSADLDHNHTLKIDKTTCTEQQMEFFIEYMVQNKDLAIGLEDNKLIDHERNEKWETLAFEMARIGPPKSAKNLMSIWKDLIKDARAEVISVARENASLRLQPSTKTCMIMSALRQPIGMDLELSTELAELRGITGASEIPLAKIFNTEALTMQATNVEPWQSVNKSKRQKSRCTQSQINLLIYYMEQNPDVALAGESHSQLIKEKWETVATKLAAVGPTKSVAHLKTTWKDLKSNARKCRKTEDSEKLSGKVKKILKILGLPFVSSDSKSEEADHGHSARPTKVASCSSVTDCDDNDDGSNPSDIWPICEVDSYP